MGEAKRYLDMCASSKTYQEKEHIKQHKNWVKINSILDPFGYHLVTPILKGEFYIAINSVADNTGLLFAGSMDDRIKNTITESDIIDFNPMNFLNKLNLILQEEIALDSNKDDQTFEKKLDLMAKLYQDLNVYYRKEKIDNILKEL